VYYFLDKEWDIQTQIISTLLAVVLTELLSSNRLHHLMASIFNLILYSSQSKEQYVENYSELSPDYKIDFCKPSTRH